MGQTWSIVEPEFNIDNAKNYEGFFTLGSGYLHVRGSLEEHLEGDAQNAAWLKAQGGGPETKTRWGTFIPGVYGNHPFLRRQMINLPWFLELTPYVDGEKLDMRKSKVSEYRRELDMRTGTLTRTLAWKTRSGAKVKVTFERFVSAERKSLCAQRMTLESDKPVTVEVRGGINADVRTRGFDHFTSVKLSAAGENGIDCRVTTDDGDKVQFVSRMAGAGVKWKFSGDARTARLTGKAKVSQGKPAVIEKYTAAATSRDLKPAKGEKAVSPTALSSQAVKLGYEKLLAEHAGVWQERWDASDVMIEGDERSQLAVRGSIYHLLRSHVPGDDRVAIEAKGYAGEQYAGMFFWDTELYMLPFFLYTSPEKARTLTDFRIRNLEGARRTAKAAKYDGAKYPWESDANGDEACIFWHFRDVQVHITADVVYGFLHYAAAADDAKYLKGPAAEVMVETARYWMSRVDTRDGKGYHLLGVMGPDEFTIMSDDNAYTNRLVSMALRAAAKVAKEGGAKPGEAKKWLEVAESLPIPRKGDLVLQSEDFPSLADIDIEKLWKPRHFPFCWVVPIERYFRSKVLKQADVILMMMLFPTEFSDKEVRKAWEYYLPMTTHDSSLSTGVHAIVATRLGLEDEAMKLWRKSSEVDMNFGTFGGAAEGIHIAGAGNNWQVPMFGFGGMLSAMQSETLTFRPKLPSGWSRLAFSVVWRKTPVFVEILPGLVRVTNKGRKAMPVTAQAQTKQVKAGETAEFAVSTTF